MSRLEFPMKKYFNLVEIFTCCECDKVRTSRYPDSPKPSSDSVIPLGHNNKTYE